MLAVLRVGVRPEPPEEEIKKESHGLRHRKCGIMYSCSVREERRRDHRRGVVRHRHARFRSALHVPLPAAVDAARQQRAARRALLARRQGRHAHAPHRGVAGGGPALPLQGLRRLGYCRPSPPPPPPPPGGKAPQKKKKKKKKKKS